MGSGGRDWDACLCWQEAGPQDHVVLSELVPMTPVFGQSLDQNAAKTSKQYSRGIELGSLGIETARFLHLS